MATYAQMLADSNPGRPTLHARHRSLHLHNCKENLDGISGTARNSKAALSHIRCTKRYRLMDCTDVKQV